MLRCTSELPGDARATTLERARGLAATWGGWGEEDDSNWNIDTKELVDPISLATSATPALKRRATTQKGSMRGATSTALFASAVGISGAAIPTNCMSFSVSPTLSRILAFSYATSPSVFVLAIVQPRRSAKVPISPWSTFDFTAIKQ